MTDLLEKEVTKRILERIAAENEKVIGEVAAAWTEISERLDMVSGDELRAVIDSFGKLYMQITEKYQDTTKAIRSAISMELLGKFLQDRHVEVRESAVKALRRINKIRALEYLIYQLRNASEDYRVDALFTMRAIADDTVTDLKTFNPLPDFNYLTAITVP